MSYLISLLPWISQVLYSLTLLPQIVQNKEEKSTSSLSSFYIYLTFAGFSFTLLYVFLKGLPIAYKIINPLGMILALIVVYQDFKYKLHKYLRYTISRGAFYWYLSTYVLTLFLLGASIVIAHYHPIIIGHFFGWLMVATWALLLVPQFYKTYTTKNVAGMSLLFVILPIIGGVFEVASFILLGLPLPSLFNGTRAIVLSGGLLMLYIRYQK